MHLPPWHTLGVGLGAVGYKPWLAKKLGVVMFRKYGWLTLTSNCVNYLYQQ